MIDKGILHILAHLPCVEGVPGDVLFGKASSAFSKERVYSQLKSPFVFIQQYCLSKMKNAGSRVALCVFILGRFVKEKQVLPLGGEGF